MCKCILLCVLLGFASTWKTNSVVKRMQAMVTQENETECWVCAHLSQTASSSELHWLAIPANNSWYDGNLTSLLPSVPAHRCQPTTVIIKGGVYLCMRHNDTGNGNSFNCNCFLLTNAIISPCPSPDSPTWGPLLTAMRLVASNTTGYPTLLRPCLFWLCGNKAYKSLPLNWAGTCTVGYIVPKAYGVKTLHAQLTHNHFPIARHKRYVENPLVKRGKAFHQFAQGFLLWLRVPGLEKAIVNISATMEQIENATVDAIQDLQSEMYSLSVVIQNRMALHFILASQGGVCATDIAIIHSNIKVLHAVAWWGWVPNVGGWFGNLLHGFIKYALILLCVIIAVYILVQLILICLRSLCSTSGSPQLAPLLPLIEISDYNDQHQHDPFKQEAWLLYILTSLSL
uniref:Uncharacterized protein n=1 Tax=Callorhinchus milii TaxID=7868 RepID=A0A4W3IGT6_CALMI